MHSQHCTVKQKMESDLNTSIITLPREPSPNGEVSEYG